jgi:hypothetical protein
MTGCLGVLPRMAAMSTKAPCAGENARFWLPTEGKFA